MCLRWAVFYVLAFVQPPIPRCVDLTDPPGRLFGTLFRAQTRDLPKSHSFSPLAAAGAPDLCPTRPRRRSDRRSDRRAGRAAGHAPRRAGPEPGAAALVGRGRGRHAARTAITTPVTPSGPPPRTADTGRVSWGQPPSGYPWESPEAYLALLHAHCHDTSHARPEGEDWQCGG